MSWKVEVRSSPAVTVRAAPDVRAVAAPAVSVTMPAQGVPGPPGPSPEDHVHTQASAASTWTVNHNLGRRPDTTVMNPGGQVVLAAVTHISNNQLLVQFASPATGSVRCL